MANYEVYNLSPLRKIIASRMSDAKQVIPHYRIRSDIHADKLVAFVKNLNSKRPDQRISISHAIVKAVAVALVECPDINIQFVDGEVLRYSQSDIAIVTAVEGGIMTPIIRCANEKPIEKISEEIKALVNRARAGKLKMSEITGGTFSISNLGMFGVKDFDAIINPPQCAILALGAIMDVPILKDGSFCVAKVFCASISLDHRVIDGVQGAMYLSALDRIIQNPELYI